MAGHCQAHSRRAQRRAHGCALSHARQHVCAWRCEPARIAMVKLTVNGKEHEISSEPDTPLLYVLRDELALNGAKFGCGLGQCGACTVLVDVNAVFSCV